LRFVSNLSALVALILVGLAVAERRRLAPRQAVLGVTLAPIAALGLARLLASPGWGELGASLLIAPFVVGALFSRRTRGESTPWQPIARVATVVLGGWLGGTTLGAAPAFLERPELLLDLPLYVWQGIAFRVEFTVDALAARLAVGNSWPSALGLLALLAVESAWPGRLLQAACGFVTRGVNALGGDFGRAKTPEDAAPSAADPTAKRRNAILAAVLVVLLIVAGTLFAKRAQEGLLAEEGALGIILSASLRMLLLPLVAGALTLWTGRGLHTLWRRRHLEPIATGFIDSPPNAP
jgi:hypothetical protein